MEARDSACGVWAGRKEAAPARVRSSGPDDANEGGVGGRRWLYAVAGGPELSGGAWGLCGTPLTILKTQVDRFFLYEANGMGGETQKCNLRLRLGVFQILKIR